MKLGLLTDIHESVENLAAALEQLRREGVDRIVSLGDIFSTGDRILETVRLLRDAGVEGVWGNHDIGLCGDVSDDVRQRFPAEVFAFAQGLRPKLRIGDLLFQHVEPWLNPELLEDLWYFEGKPTTAAQVQRGFVAGDHRISFHGHYHCWLLGTAAGIHAWDGSTPIDLPAPDRYLVVVHALTLGHFATFDTVANRLTPFRIEQPEGGTTRV